MNFINFFKNRRYILRFYDEQKFVNKFVHSKSFKSCYNIIFIWTSKTLYIIIYKTMVIINIVKNFCSFKNTY